MTITTKRLIFLLFSLAYSFSYAQEAALNGDQLSLPVVAVGSELYAVDLVIDGAVSPPELEVTSAVQVSNGTSVAAFSGSTLSIPSIVVDGLDYNVSLSLISEQPVRFRLLDSGLNSSEAELREQALGIFESSLATDVVQARCTTCHVDGGVARNSGLVFQHQSASSTLNNFAAFETLLNSREDGREHILARVSGTDHPGGNQLPVGSTDYLALESMLQLLEGSTTGGTTQSIAFFSSASLKSNAETLRKAAIILAGRLPTSDELAAVNSGDESVLRQALRDLMQGDGFHEFLVDGANDRLLIRGIRDFGLLDGCDFCFPTFVNRRNEIALDELRQGIDFGFESAQYNISIDHGLKEAPLELIAYVVENERPYSEILTADYMMLNPASNFAVEGTASFNNANDYLEFQPGIMTGAYSPGDEAEYEELEEIDSIQVIDPGPLRIDYPHSGVLNTIAFLARYPSTATNRNRARARWTFYHFLGIDIERSAPRTTDPVALADTNNPTLLNENCTVCHATMDPVAGSFQNYSDEGFYRIGWNGLDSLDEFYKYPEDGTTTLYEIGDTWYRDMRDPGIFGETAPHPDNSIQWLAQQIVQEPGFGTATVKFWWPSLIGSEVLSAPEVESDVDYQAQLIAYDAQNQAIQSLANEFMSSGMNLKDLLVEIMLTPWFRASSIDTTQLTSELQQAHDLAETGSEKLLTPERLNRKTHALTGFNWSSYIESELGQTVTGLGDTYRLYYGGINSSSVTKRATVMTPLMSTVAMSHALESACPIVLKEFILDSDQRLLFEGIEDSVTPENGEVEIRNKLVQLHERLLGKTYATDSQEINDAYQLYVDSWQERVDSGEDGFMFTETERCEFYLDIGFFDGTPIEDNATMLVEGEYPYIGFNWEVIDDYIWPLTVDPNHTKQAWVTVITYLMTHYHYLYE